MKSILKVFSEHGTFVQPEALDYIAAKEDPDKFTNFLLESLQEYPLILTTEILQSIEAETTKHGCSDTQDASSPEKQRQNMLLKKLYDPNPTTDEEFDQTEDYEPFEKSVELEEEKPQLEQKQDISVTPVQSWKPLAREYSSDVKIISDISGKSTCEGTTQDFMKLFQNRFHILRKILRTQRREMARVIPINRLNKSMQEVQFIGIVASVRTTLNGHKLIEVEDETGTTTVMALKTNSPVFALACDVLVDEVIGVVGKLSRNGDLIIVQNIVFPDIRLQQSTNRTEEPICVAFLSDIHIGSNMFLSNEWKMFLRWTNGDLGNSRQRTVASKIKYLVLPGDLVDGIGIYPNQEAELSIPNIYEQYKELARQLEYVPDHITLLMQPGNHDAVRPAEPQPAFEKELQDLFTGKEFIFLGNPSYFSLHNVEILSYHGQSLLDFATNLQSLNYNEPTEVMKVMLRKRHLAPVYGGYTPLAPEHEDYMVISKVPDIFVTGHVHTAKIDQYRGVTLINASSWQAQTTYQKMLNFIPDSAKLPIVNLKTGSATTMDFSHQIA